MLLRELKDRHNDFIFNGQHAAEKKLYVVTKDNKRHGPFTTEDGADSFITHRKDLKSPSKKWI
jgi:hypothetical protein